MQWFDLCTWIFLHDPFHPVIVSTRQFLQTEMFKSINFWYTFESLNPDRPAADLKEAYNMSLVGDEKVICFVFTFDIRGSVRVACRNLCVRISAETYNYNAKHLITGVSNCYGVKHNLINQ